jgi:LEA14-like dessication related protein
MTQDGFVQTFTFEAVFELSIRNANDFPILVATLIS